MITRRQFFGYLPLAALAALIPGYPVAIEPMRLVTTRYRLSPRGWPKGKRLRIVALADLHACRPWMGVNRIAGIVRRANALKPDVIVLLGDYTTGMNLTTSQVHSREWAPILGRLSAPLGVHAIMGNHDWWEDKTAQRAGHGPTFGHRALRRAGISVLSNDAIRLKQDGAPFWLVGLEDQLALLRRTSDGRARVMGLDDLGGALSQVTDDAPIILLAHEPDIFPSVPDRVALTLSGHTHGGQVRLFGHSPITPSRFGDRYTYGLVREGGRTMIVSGGLGCSILPVRLGVPPEIVLVELSA